MPMLAHGQRSHHDRTWRESRVAAAMPWRTIGCLAGWAHPSCLRQLQRPEGIVWEREDRPPPGGVGQGGVEGTLGPSLSKYSQPLALLCSWPDPIVNNN